jgi:hypothetical protein
VKSPQFCRIYVPNLMQELSQTQVSNFTLDVSGAFLICVVSFR